MMDVTGYEKLTSRNKMMQASATPYRIPQRRNNVSRPEGYPPLRRLIPHCRAEVFVCQRCGEGCTAQHWCKAVDRQCFSCRRYGHYSRFCGETTSRNATGLSVTTQPKAKTKSSRKQQRDRNRYNLYKERKSVCVLMPFYSTCDEDIQSSVLKTTKTVHDIQELYSENAYLKRTNEDLFDQMYRENHWSTVKELSKCSRENAELKKENVELNDKLQQQKLAISDLEQELFEQASIIQDQDLELVSTHEKFTHQCDYFTEQVKGIEMEKQQLQQQVTSKEQQCNKLKEELQSATSTTKANDAKIESLHSNINRNAIAHDKPLNSTIDAILDFQKDMQKARSKRRALQKLPR